MNSYGMVLQTIKNWNCSKQWNRQNVIFYQQMLYVVIKFSVFCYLYDRFLFLLQCQFILVVLMHLWTGPVILYVLQNILKTDLPQIFHGLVVYFKTIFCSFWSMFFMGRHSYKSIAKFWETLFHTNFLINNLNLLHSLKNELLQHFEQIVTTELHSLLKLPHWYQQQLLRD